MQRPGVNSLTLRVESPGTPPFDYECAGTSVVVGRASTAEIVIPDHRISRRHVRLFTEGDVWMVEDLGARNGTTINGARLEGTRPLAPGDVIRLGGTLIRVTRPQTESGAASETPAPLGLGKLGSSIFKSAAALVETAGMDAQPSDRQAARLKALNDFHRALAGPVSLDDLLALLLDRLFAVLQPEEGLVLLKRPDGELVTAASRRLAGVSGELLVSRRLADEVVGKGTAALVMDVAMDDRFSQAQSVVAAGIRSILAAPMLDPSGCLGMIALYSRAHVRRFGEEDLELLVSLASAAALRIRNVAFVEEATARRVMDRELALAHDIQMAMLPRHLPTRPEIEVAASLTPARAVGGDLYDFLLVGDTIWFIVADAAGKGVSAALFMAVTRTLFRAFAAAAPSVGALLSMMNAELARNNDEQFFVTAWVGRLELASGTLTCSNAGHPPALHLTRTGIETRRGSGTGIALGILEDATYPEETATVQRGDTLLLYTDGVTEAVSPRGELFSERRLRERLEGADRISPAQLVQRIGEAVATFTSEASQEDDLTMFAIRYRG
jgi:phosphoserine phosphatase RsbU/P